MARAREAGRSALFERRLGKSAEELGDCDGNEDADGAADPWTAFVAAK